MFDQTFDKASNGKKGKGNRTQAKGKNRYKDTYYVTNNETYNKANGNGNGNGNWKYYCKNSTGNGNKTKVNLDKTKGNGNQTNVNVNVGDNDHSKPDRKNSIRNKTKPNSKTNNGNDVNVGGIDHGSNGSNGNKSKAYGKNSNGVLFKITI